MDLSRIPDEDLDTFLAMQGWGRRQQQELATRTLIQRLSPSFDLDVSKVPGSIADLLAAKRLLDEGVDMPMTRATDVYLSPEDKLVALARQLQLPIVDRTPVRVFVWSVFCLSSALGLRPCS